MDIWTEETALAHAKENGRIAVMVYENDDQSFTAYYEGVKVRGKNPFGIDSDLDSEGVPRPRNLYLISDES